MTKIEGTSVSAQCVRSSALIERGIVARLCRERRKNIQLGQTFFRRHTESAVGLGL